MAAREGGVSFRELLLQEEKVCELLGPDGLAGCFDPAYYLRRVDLIYRRLGLGCEK
jgi:adenylosuccinate lyase